MLLVDAVAMIQSREERMHTDADTAVAILEKIVTVDDVFFEVYPPVDDDQSPVADVLVCVSWDVGKDAVSILKQITTDNPFLVCNVTIREV